VEKRESKKIYVLSGSARKRAETSAIHYQVLTSQVTGQ
jgi:hypothetical protein